ncbi:MAG: GNAT family N-acetyltransferase [Actinomycetota bacterium]|nr:GNAT family N-acetyltransferase [Actinomycetota bacterium]
MTPQLATYPDHAADVLLRNGLAVRIRPLSGADAPLLADGFARLSARSRQSRFLTGKRRLSASELRYFTEIDHRDHEALAAVSLIDGRGVGVARYVRSAADPQAADVAVTVVDEWQGSGVGTELMTRLIDRAITEGIRRFTALIAADNLAVLRLLRNLSVDYVELGCEEGAVEYEIMLPAPGDGAA